jgi:dTDP-4-dehydrorhamnose reductase
MNKVNVLLVANLKKKPRILIIGNYGQVGYALTIHLQVFAELIFLNRTIVDMSNFNALEHFLHNNVNNFDMLINASAYTAVDKAESEQEACLTINYRSVQVIALFCEYYHKPYIHYSTDYIFDGSSKEYTENSPPNPINYYGYTKMLAESAVVKLSQYLIFRTTWVYDHRGHNFLLTMLRLMLEKKELSIINDQFGAPTWAHTIAAATSIIVQKAFNACDYFNDINGSAWWNRYSGIYNLTAANHTTWFDYAQKIADYKKNNVKLMPISSAEYITVAKRPQYSILNTDKITNTFNLVLPEWQNALQSCLYMMH